MKTTLRHRRPGVLVLAMSIIAVAAWSQPKPLNPLVARSAQPHGAVPAECEEGLSATPVLRVEPSQIPAPQPEPQATVVVPALPTNALRAALQDTQTALTRNDRAAFDAALVREKAIVAGYPSGGERRGAEEVVRIHEAAGHLWDAQFASPFFRESDPAYKIANAYSGYGDAVRRGVLIDRNGARFYPAAESRDFLTRLAGERLQRMGMRVSTAPTRNAQTSSPARASTKRRSSTTTPAKKPAAAKPAPAKAAVASPAPPPPAPVVTPPVATTVTTTTDPVLPTTSIVNTTSGDTSLTTATDITTTDATSTETTSTETTSIASDTVTTDVAPAPQPRGRSIILPTILILVGLGVLIALFRASK